MPTFNRRVVEATSESGGVHRDHEGAAAVQQLQVRRALHPVPVARKPQSHFEGRLFFFRAAKDMKAERQRERQTQNKLGSGVLAHLRATRYTVCGMVRVDVVQQTQNVSRRVANGTRSAYFTLLSMCWSSRCAVRTRIVDWYAKLYAERVWHGKAWHCIQPNN